MGNNIKRCPKCGNNNVSVHLEGWFYDHTKPGHGYDELCPGSGAQAPKTEASVGAKVAKTQVWIAAAALAKDDPAAEDGTYAFEDYIDMVREVLKALGMEEA